MHSDGWRSLCLPNCEGVLDRLARPKVGRIHRPGDQGFALGKVAGNDLLAALVLPFDEEFVGTGDVSADLPFLDPPPRFSSKLHNVVELGDVQADAQHLLDPPL